MNIGRYRKGIIAGTGALIAILAHHLGADNAFVLDAIAVATAAGVYQVPNQR